MGHGKIKEFAVTSQEFEFMHRKAMQNTDWMRWKLIWINFYKISIVLSEITHFKINFWTFGRSFVTLASLYIWINGTNLNSRVSPRDFSSSLVSGSFSGRSEYMSVSSQPKWYKFDGIWWYISGTKFIFKMYNGLQCVPVIYALGSAQ